MNTSGEAADQVVRMSLEVGEAALKITGAGAKQLAVLLYAILNEQKKTRGRARLETLVRSGKPLTVFSVKEQDMKKFVEEAKRYGVLYCAIRNPRGSSDGMVDIMVKEEDASRINRIVERFRFASVTEAAQIKTEIQKSREEKKKSGTKEVPGEKSAGNEKSVPEQERPVKSQADLLVDELLGKPVQKEEAQPQNPSLAKTEKSRLSEPDNGYVSCQPDGKPRALSSFNQALTKMCERNGLPAITVHGLRHMFATILIERGVPLVKISGLLGHSSIHTTYEYYCDVMDEKDKIIAFMNDTFVPERTGTEG